MSARTRPRTALAGSAPAASRAAMGALAALAVPPALWFLHLNVSYALVPPSCRWGHRWAFLGATVVALAGIALAARRSDRAWRSGDAGAERDVVAFLGLVGLVLAAIFAATTLAVGASVLLVDPCR